MDIKHSLTGILSFIIVLFTMPLGHAAMIFMEKIFGHSQIYLAAVSLGFLGLLLLIIGTGFSNDSKATFMGLFAGLFIWTGWIEFAYVYYAKRYEVSPLISNGEIVTKPEYLILPSSIGFIVVIILYFLLGTRTGCLFFSWFQDKLGLKIRESKRVADKNKAIVTFMELIIILWTFYLVLLFSYDNNFAGDRHFITYVVAFGSLLWSLYLLKKLMKISKIGYAVRYAIPTVIIFWNFVEILGRWGFFKEIWIVPGKYKMEMLTILVVFIILIILSLVERKKK